MPTYIVTSQAGQLTLAAKQRIAEEITSLHQQVTGAQGFFAQVIFSETPTGNHFIGGVPCTAAHLFVYGHIRAGRTADQKRSLLIKIVDALAALTDVPRRQIWAYVTDLPPSQMIEYGHVLPEPGQENTWLDDLPADDRNYMLSIGQ